MAKATEIEYLPFGWKWVGAGKSSWNYTNTKGVTITSTARHAEGPNGAVLSTRQVQNQQRAARAAAGMPKPPTVQRQGRTRTIKGPAGLATDVTRSTSGLPTGVGSLYNPNRHGQTVTWVFRSIEDARDGIINKYVPPPWAKYGILKARFTERLVGTDRIGSDTVGVKNGYATISGFADPGDIVDDATNYNDYTGDIRNVWIGAENRLKNYDMSGKQARVYIEWQEK